MASASGSCTAAATGPDDQGGFARGRAARDARRRLTEQIERGEVRHRKETFGGYGKRRLARRRAFPVRRLRIFQPSETFLVGRILALGY